MVYNVTAVHSWNLHHGIVEYMTGGDDFASLATKAVERFPKMKFELPVTPLDTDTLYGVLHNTMAAYLSNFQLGATRAVENRAREFLKSIDVEYRRWRFEGSMEASDTGNVMEELLPLIKLHKANNATGDNLTRTLVDYTTEMLAGFFSEVVVDEFQDAVTTFLTSHRGRVVGIKLTLDFPQCQYNLMDMRMLIDVSED